MQQLQKISSLLPDSLKCIICIEIVKNVIFIPCFHVVLCKRCYEELVEKRCPICREPVSSIVKIFSSSKKKTKQ